MSDKSESMSSENMELEEQEEKKSEQEVYGGRNLRPKRPSLLDYFKKAQESESPEREYSLSSKKLKISQKNYKRNIKQQQEKESEDEEEIQENDESNSTTISAESLMLSKLPKNKKQLHKQLEAVENRIAFYKEQFLKEQYENKHKKSKVSDISIPIYADIQSFDFKKLAAEQLKLGGRLFDVIMMDPPWQLSSSQPSRGVAIGYDSLSDDIITRMPIPSLQTDGFIFIWAINAKYAIACKLIEHWGYKLVDEITWVKKTVNGKIAKGHGFYLQHAKESCLVGVKGKVDHKINKNIACDVIFSERRGQSQKPEEIYQYIETLLPNGFYLEVFGRRNNLQGKWVTIGNEI